MSDDYEVGYKKPPKHTQFKPGESGNRKGRPPKETTNLIQAVEEILMTKEKVKVNGEYVDLARIEIFLMALADGATKNSKDRKNFIDLIKVLKLEDRFVDYF